MPEGRGGVVSFATNITLLRSGKMNFLMNNGLGERGKLRIRNYELRIFELNGVSTFKPLNSVALNL